MSELAAAVIVRDAEKTIETCIRSVRPHVGGVYVYLGGESSDGTVDALERLQREPGPPLIVEQGEWRDDFAWAREQSFAMVDAGHSWIFWLDADDELISGEHLAALAAGADRLGVPFAYVMHEYAWLDGERRLHAANRVVRRDSGRWEGIVHEHFREHERYRGKMGNLSMPPEIMHTREQDGKQGRDPAHYLPLIEKAARDPEHNPRAFEYLGRSLLALGRFEEAQQALQRYLDDGWDAIEGDPNYWRRDALEMIVRAASVAGDIAVAQARSYELEQYRERLASAESKMARRAPKVGRNQPCPCGSGQKFKRCCGASRLLAV